MFDLTSESSQTEGVEAQHFHASFGKSELIFQLASYPNTVVDFYHLCFASFASLIANVALSWPLIAV